jgi:uncharacterized protein (DUF433 family)
MYSRAGIIDCDSEIMSGVLVFVGTRVPLPTFFDYLEGEEQTDKSVLALLHTH